MICECLTRRNELEVSSDKFRELNSYVKRLKKDGFIVIQKIKKDTCNSLPYWVVLKKCLIYEV